MSLNVEPFKRSPRQALMLPRESLSYFSPDNLPELKELIKIPHHAG